MPEEVFKTTKKVVPAHTTTVKVRKRTVTTHTCNNCGYSYEGRKLKDCPNCRNLERERVYKIFRTRWS